MPPREEDERDERFDLEQLREETSSEKFDRVAFANAMVALIRPPGTRVAIYSGKRIRVEVGRQWGKPGCHWATVEVSPNSSRRAIAYAVLSIRGEGVDAPLPYSLDLLLRPYR